MPFRIIVTEETLTRVLGRLLSSLVSFLPILHLFGIRFLEPLGSNVSIKACAAALLTAPRVLVFSSTTRVEADPSGHRTLVVQ